jgi:hypothetical protein
MDCLETICFRCCKALGCPEVNCGAEHAVLQSPEPHSTSPLTRRILVTYQEDGRRILKRRTMACGQESRMLKIPTTEVSERSSPFGTITGSRLLFIHLDNQILSSRRTPSASRGSSRRLRFFLHATLRQYRSRSSGHGR